MMTRTLAVVTIMLAAGFGLAVPRSSSAPILAAAMVAFIAWALVGFLQWRRDSRLRLAAGLAVDPARRQRLPQPRWPQA